MSSQILFTEAHWCSEGVVGFRYDQCGRSPAWVYVATVRKQIKYISASGAETVWHGQAIEEGELGRFVSIGQRKKHRIWFSDFHPLVESSKTWIKIEDSTSRFVLWLPGK